MSTTPALLLAAGGVGFGHAVLPDHWVPLAVVGRTRGYPLAKVARLSGLAGVAHVLVSLVLGAVIIAVGLPLRSSVQSIQDTIIGGLLIATGVGFLVMELTGHGHGHVHAEGEHSHSSEGYAHGAADEGHSHGAAGDGHSHSHPGHAHGPAAGVTQSRPPSDSRLGSLAAVMVPFGAAASPDLTILPVFLAAAAAGTGAALGSLVVFAIVTVGTIVSLTLFATAGGYQLHGAWLDRWGNLFTAAVLVVIGTLVLLGEL